MLDPTAKGKVTLLRCQAGMEFESASLADLGHHNLPGLGPHNDRGFGVFDCPHPRFRELDFCRPNSGSSTITIKDVDRYIGDLTRPSKHFKKSKQKKVVETIEETALKEAIGSDPNVREEKDCAEKAVKEDVEEEMEEDIGVLEIFKEVEKPTFVKADALDEEAEDFNEIRDIAEVEKLGPKSSYTPQTGGEPSEMKSAEVSQYFEFPGNKCDQQFSRQ